MKLQNANGKIGPVVNPEKFESMRAALLSVLPPDGPGLTFDEFCALVEPVVPRGFFPDMGSVRWYAKSVQLHLEAVGEVRRDYRSRPLRFRRVDGAAATAL
jgi:hypothetical protein